MEYEIKEENDNIKIKLIQNGIQRASATCYYKNTPKKDEKNIGTIGEFETENSQYGNLILKKCEEILKQKEVEFIVAPMNGNTWNKYRTLKYSTEEPQFMLENVNPKEYNDILIEAGFKEIYTYTSTKGLISDCYHSIALDKLEEKLNNQNILIRKFNKEKYLDDLRKIYNISIKSFIKNPLYTQIEEKEFLNQYIKYIQLVDEELILIAEQNGKEIGFIFAIPNLTQKAEKINTLIVKTVAVIPGYEEYAIGNILLRKIAQKAQEKGYEKWIFAFMYSNNTSQKMAKRNKTNIIREYALYGKEL